ncbi:hypothetical protein FB451DRAFT_1363233 [Mycena latifolia]|nr:hypothetical protein FB451DRAFT_1363233 [Mycena latifolia]
MYGKRVPRGYSSLRDERYPPGNTCLRSRWMCGRPARTLGHPVGTLRCKRTTHRSAEDVTRASRPAYHNVDAQHACSPWRLRSSQKQRDERDRRTSHASPPAHKERGDCSVSHSIGQLRRPDESSVETKWRQRAGSGAALREPAESGKSAGAGQMRARTPGENDDSDSSPTTHDSGGAFALRIDHAGRAEPRKRCV